MTRHFLPLALAVLIAAGNVQSATTANVQVITVTTSAWVQAMNWNERIPEDEHTNAVNDLAKAGVICKVLGHQWRGGRPGEGDMGNGLSIQFADYHPGVTFRTCKICGKCERKEEGDWQ